MTPLLTGVFASQISGHLTPAFSPTGSYDALAVYTVPAGGMTNIVFASIPNTYSHLQIRGIGRRTDAQAYYDNMMFYFNTDNTSTNYYRHLIVGDGSSAAAGVANGYPAVVLPGNSQAANVFGGFVVDILDYASTTKNKTVRTIGGVQTNGTDSEIRFQSGLWNNTSAINTITFIGNSGLTQFSQLSLYGVK